MSDRRAATSRWARLTVERSPAPPARTRMSIRLETGLSARPSAEAKAEPSLPLAIRTRLSPATTISDRPDPEPSKWTAGA